MFNPRRIFLDSSPCWILWGIFYLVRSRFRFSRSWCCIWGSWFSWGRGCCRSSGSCWCVLSLLSLLLFIILLFLFLFLCSFNNIWNRFRLTNYLLRYWNLLLWLLRSFICWCLFYLWSSWDALYSRLPRHDWSLIRSNYFLFSGCNLSLWWNVFFWIWNLWINTMALIFFILICYLLLCFSPFLYWFI